MPRKPRLELASMPHHIVQRGVDQQAVFFDRDSYQCYQQYLHQYASLHKVAIHSWCLMTNHIHLLLTPAQNGSISRMMQRLNSAYVRLINSRFRRSGHLWAGRFRSAVVDSDHYLLSCMRYIELNPVRAAMVAHPSQYPWSSYHQNGLGIHQPALTPHPVYLALGATAQQRQQRYRELIEDPLDQRAITALRQATQQGTLYGSDRFQAQISAMLGREVITRRPGRPRKG